MSRFLHPQYAGLEAYTPGEQPRDRQYIKLNTNAFKLFTFFILKSPFKLTSYKFSFQQESINNFMLFSVFPDLDKYSYFAYKTSANHTFLICSYPE